MPRVGERDEQFRPFLDALDSELQSQLSLFASRTLRSIFLGGGTPSLLKPSELEKIFEAIQKVFSWDDTCEVTLEVNPDTLDLDKARAFRSLGINRISMGLQALDEDALRLLGREHNIEQARYCVDVAREAGFDNINLDMIYGRPKQTLSGWERELQELLEWEPEHVSLYELILEPGTPMTRAIRKGELVLPEEETRLEMYRLARELMCEGGMQWYEVSNYAKPNRESRHNLDNWRGGEYLGVGPGAHSFGLLSPWGERRANPRNLPLYTSQPDAAPWHPREAEDVCKDALLNGLRLREGFQHKPFHETYGLTFSTQTLEKLPSLQESGYLDVEEERWVLTPRGMELLDAILVYLDPQPAD